MKSLSVYIHIPFCAKKCNYCDFLSAPATAEKRKQYLAALKSEMQAEAKRYEDFCVKSVFFGGGTPSILEAQAITELLDVLKTAYHMDTQAEITLEMNPATATKEKMESWKKAGINRLSIGLQSAHDEELKMLGRIHCYADFLESYQNAREVGFTNVNIDLMSGLPGQDRKKWEDTLQKVLALKPEHISAYSLIIEEGTEICQNIERYPALPSEEEDRKMYQRTKEILKENGFTRYEISNYAKEGYECKHNCVYWQRGNYVGFGLGAASMVENVRWTNTRDFDRYLANCRQPFMLQEEKEVLSERDCMEEFMFLGLRMMQGVKKADFTRNFSKSMEEVYGDVIAKWEAQQMLYQDESHVWLSEQGIDVSNVIFSDFLA